MAKIAVVGCGAMGSVYAALMVDAGHEVHAVTLWPDHAEAMATNGLRCEGASGDRTVPIHASTTTDDIGPCDLVIIATKAFDVEAAARSCISLLGPETIVQTIQNGLGSPEIAAPILGADRVAVGVVGGFGASIRAPGLAHHNGMEMIRFGALAGLPKQLLQASAKIWESAGFKVALFHDIKQMVWEKLIMNVAFSGTSLHDRPDGRRNPRRSRCLECGVPLCGRSHRRREGFGHPPECRRSDRAHPKTRRQNSRRAPLDAAGLYRRPPMRGGCHQRRDPSPWQTAGGSDANQ